MSQTTERSRRQLLVSAAKKLAWAAPTLTILFIGPKVPLKADTYWKRVAITRADQTYAEGCNADCQKAWTALRGGVPDPKGEVGGAWGYPTRKYVRKWFPGLADLFGW